MNTEERASFLVRKRILKMANECGGSTHLGGSLSMADMLTVLYKKYLTYDAKNPAWPARDYFILSKGHCTLAYYAVLAECGFLSEDLIATFQKDGSLLSAHPVMNLELGIESSTGSLGQGISTAVGLAKGLALQKLENQVYVLIGNGEANEGSVWEAAMIAGQWKLENLTVLLDQNHMQSDGDSENIISGGSMAARWSAVGFDVQEVDGNDVAALCRAFDGRTPGKPHLIIGNTIKGCGVSFMEGNNAWHHNRLTDKLYAEAIQELEKRYA